MSRFWKIEEAVGGGFYVVLDGIFETADAAERVIDRLPSSERMRAVEYQTGTRWSGGPTRTADYTRVDAGTGRVHPLRDEDWPAN